MLSYENSSKHVIHFGQLVGMFGLLTRKLQNVSKKLCPAKMPHFPPRCKMHSDIDVGGIVFSQRGQKKCSITMTILPISVCIYSLNNSVNRGISLCPINSRKCLLVNPQKSSFCEKMRKFCHYPFSFTTVGITKNATNITKNHAFRFQKGYKDSVQESKWTFRRHMHGIIWRRLPYNSLFFGPMSNTI